MNNSNSLMNTDGGGVVWRDDKMPVLDNLMERILARGNLQQAWVEFGQTRAHPAVTG